MSRLEVLDRWVERCIRWFAMLAMTAIVALMLLGVVARFVPVFSMSGYDELIEFLIAWIVFLVAALLWRDGTLFRADGLELLLRPPAASAVRRAIQVIMLVFALVFTWYGWTFAFNAAETVAFLGVSKKGWFAAMPVAGVLMVAYSLAGMVRAARGGRGLGAVPSWPQTRDAN